MMRQEEAHPEIRDSITISGNLQELYALFSRIAVSYRATIIEPKRRPNHNKEYFAAPQLWEKDQKTDVSKHYGSLVMRLEEIKPTGLIAS